jgi:hypothetical protein
VKPGLKVVSINDRAVRDLRYIRETMERAGSFTAVPGWGGILMGLTALAAVAITWQMGSRDLWFAVWMSEAVLAAAIGVLATVKKARKWRTLLHGPGRQFGMSLLPALAAGAVLTGILYQQRLFDLMPGVWLLLYGAGVMSCGTYSVKVVPLLGLGCMLLGSVALLVNWEWAQWLMAAGFGGLHVTMGAVIVRRFGG